MRRFPPYMIVAVCGILFLSAGMVIITADSTNPPVTPDVELPTMTPTETIVVPAEQAAQPDAPPADVPAAPVQEVVPPVDAVVVVEVVPTVEAAVVQPTVVVEQPQSIESGVVEAPVQAQENVAAEVPAAIQADNGVVITPVIDQPNTPLGTLPPPSDVIPTAESLIVQPTVEIPLVQPTTDTNQTVVEFTQVTGYVTVPLHADFSGVVVMLTLPDGQVMQTITDGTGSFTFSNLAPGGYRLDAGISGYLSSQAVFNLAAGQTLVLPSSTLVGGDTNLDNRIDLTDATLIAANFDGAVTVAGADVNRDGIVDIRDLTAIGAYFGQVGPTPWQP